MADTVMAAEGFRAPLSLYLDLEEGQTADLEVVAQAVLAWAAAIKKLAFHIDPAIEIRIEFTSGTEGSLSINSIIKSIKEAKDEPITFKALIIVALLWFGAHVVEKAFDTAWDRVVGTDVQPVEFSQEQLKELSALVSTQIKNNTAQTEVQQVYRELERDPAIKGVGSSPIPGARPDVIVPKSEFPARSGREIKRDQAILNQRTVSARTMVTLIRPVLLAAERSWGLRTSLGDFGATMKDKDFVDRTLSGSTAIPMIAGIEMDVEMETREEFRGGAWTVTSRAITHVYALKRPPITGDLFSPKAQNNQTPDGANDDGAG